MFEFHADRKRYFDIQQQNTEKYVIPFIKEKFDIRAGMRILEIGCGEGGVLLAFVKEGCTGVGVEFDTGRIVTGSQWMENEIATGKIRFISKDIYDVDPEAELGGKFDIILLKDVIEHIHDQQKLIAWMKQFLQPNGVIFFGFPPWQMPFGGHQQLCKHKWLASLPYYHLLPAFMYRGILKTFHEPVDLLMEIKETGISIERFERICKDSGYTIAHNTHYFINPIYEYKFGWKPRKQAGLVKAIPYLRDFFTTCVYYLITPK